MDYRKRRKQLIQTNADFSCFRQKLKTLSLFCLLGLSLFSCRAKNQLVFLSDRHGLSFDVVLHAEAALKGCDTLVLFDQHNDASSYDAEVTSFNWVGRLIESGFIQKVYWVPSYKLDDFSKRANQKYLRKNLSELEDARAERIFSAFYICGLDELKKLNLGKVIVTFDFDVLCKAQEPASFIAEAITWIEAQNCRLLTLAFSSAYQDEPAESLGWLETFIRGYGKKADWLINCGSFGEKPESNEENEKWKLWQKKPEIFSCFEAGFYSGAYFWLNIPPVLQDELLKKRVKPYNKDDSTTAAVLKAWQNTEYRAFREKYAAKLPQYKEIAKDALLRSLDGEFFPPVYSSYDLSEKNSVGVAVRFRTLTNDRGCFALYCGIENIEGAIRHCAYEAAKDPRYPHIEKSELDGLYVNISIFSDWQKMSGALDFVPGFDSLIMDNGDAATQDLQRTLLQASVATERGYSRSAFLRRLCRKAQIAETAYKDAPQALEFYKSPTLTYTFKVLD